MAPKCKPFNFPHQTARASLSPYPLSFAMPPAFARVVIALLVTLASATAPPDLLIIGAGTSGCALAARLCVALPTQNITLLERASPRNSAANFLVRSPRQMWLAWESSSVVEPIRSLPSSGLLGRTVPVFTGATLGGSSAINGMQWVVPRDGSVETWGIHNLTTNSARRYYQRAFRTVGFAAQIPPLRQRHVDAFLGAARRAGYDTGNKDPIDPSEAFDFFENRMAIDLAGVRRDSCTAYLSPVLNTKCAHNLRLVQGASVTRLLLSRESRPRATGVEYTVSGPSAGERRTRKFRVAAGGEVIVTAGPFGSPKLLQLSGIGPRDVLQKAGIPLRVALPVGTRTVARPFAALSSEIRAPLEPSNNSTLLNDPAQRALWDAGRGSVLGRSSFIANGRDRADAYLTGTGSFFPELVDRSIVSASCNSNVALSRGFVRVTTRNASAPLEVQTALLQKRADFLRMQRCLLRLRGLHEQLPRRFNAKWTDPSDGRITERWIRDNAGWAGHMVGGCAVGEVLTDRLRVKGVRGLRVVDSSSLRNMPESAGPMSSTYMLAEFMAEVIGKEIKEGSGA